MAEVKLVWAREASDHFEEIYTYLAKEASVEIAIKVGKDILDAIDKLVKNPLANPVDRFYSGKLDSFRAFTIHRYRVSYFAGEDQVEILRIRHTSRKPLRS